MRVWKNKINGSFIQTHGLNLSTIKVHLILYIYSLYSNEEYYLYIIYTHK